MSKITENRLGSAVVAAQRLELALNGLLDYMDVESFEEDVDLVVCLLSETRDACWPELENRARAKATAERT